MERGLLFPPGSQGERSALEDLEHGLRLFMAADRRLLDRYKRAGGSLSPGRLRALMVLMQEEKTSTQLSEAAGLHKTSITFMVEQLESMGMITRRRDERDGRVFWVSLTKKGRSVVAQHSAEWRERLSSVFADTSDEELDAA